MTTNSKQDWFRQDKATGRWFRVLIRGGGDFTHQVEFPLTPEFDTTWEWRDTKECQIHRIDMRDNPIKDRSKWTHCLPSQIHKTMSDRIGSELTEFLFNADIYSMIDWNKFNKVKQCGVPLKLCRPDYDWRFEHNFTLSDTISVNYLREQDFETINGFRTTPDMMLIGGISSKVDNNELLIFGYYHLTTGYICFALNYLIDGHQHSSRFSQRYKTGWLDDFNMYIEEINSKGVISVPLRDGIKNMTKIADCNLETFMLDK